MFGPASATALLAGIGAGLALPWLPVWPLLVMTLLAGTAMAWHWRGAWILGVFLCGFGFAGLHAAFALHEQIPVGLEGRANEISGRIVDLPLHEARRTRFEFMVDDDAQQARELRGKRLRIAWFDQDPQARAGLVAGSRWRLQVRLRAPQALRNPGGNDGEKQALAARIAATGLCWSRRWRNGLHHRPASMPGAKRPVHGSQQPAQPRRVLSVHWRWAIPAT